MTVFPLLGNYFTEKREGKTKFQGAYVCEESKRWTGTRILVSKAALTLPYD